MKLRPSNTSIKKRSSPAQKTIIRWDSDLGAIIGSKSKSSENILSKLNNAHLHSIQDLLWVFPLRIIELPPLRSFESMEENKIFIGRGKILNIQARPNFRARGKGRAMLYNLQAFIKDTQSERIVSLRWFNCYSSVKEKISKCQFIEFLGTPTIYSGQLQVTNPEFSSIENLESPSLYAVANVDLKIQYPTVNTIPGMQIKKLIDKIPADLWDKIEESLPEKLIQEKNFLSLSDSFKVIHAKIKPEKTLEARTTDRLVYEEFFTDQLKIHLRRQFLKKPKARSFQLSDDYFFKLSTFFPFPFTEDQEKTMEEIRSDLKSNHPMMRLVQGDVGCGKTWVALMTALIVVSQKAQVAFMCPTEALAIQHYQGAIELFQKIPLNISLLLGSTPQKEKRLIQQKLIDGEIDLIIGTHALIQETISFKELGLAIIDEQHKFGVDQRIKLTSKGEGTHCLIMSATPIPRSLSLTQYGDLDISTIRTMPSGRKGHKTRIVTADTYQAYLNFINTRLSLKEQVYVVVPAINENPEQDFHNLEAVLANYQQIFKNFRVQGLHGQMKAAEKAHVFHQFTHHQIDILIATSVIEVGINVPNATIMSIINPERFGLSSLHQLRGRVGRGLKPGFCFLINDKNLNSSSLERLKVIEQNTDGFKIAEEDLRLRGEGDLFGTEQSGAETQRRFSNIVTHSHILFQAKIDVDRLLQEKNPEIFKLLDKFSRDEKIFTTV